MNIKEFINPDRPSILRQIYEFIRQNKLTDVSVKDFRNYVVIEY